MPNGDDNAERERKIKALIDIANYHWKEFDGRRLQEWKANFSLWTALAALVAFSNWKEANLTLNLVLSVEAFLLWVFMVYWIGWTTGMWRRNDRDIRTARRAMERVRQIIGELVEDDKKDNVRIAPSQTPCDYINVARNWSRGSQLAFTFGFCLLAGVTVWHHRVIP